MIFLFLTVVIMSCMLIFKIGSLSASSYAQSGITQSTRRLQIAETDGMIYDRNMVPLVNRDLCSVIVVNPTEAAMKVLAECLTEDEYKTALEKGSKGRPFLLYTNNYNGSCDDIEHMAVYNRYSATDTAQHIIGYTDNEGNGVYGMEKAFESLMDKNHGSLTVRYHADATGRMLRGEGFEIVSDNYASSGGLVLTLDYSIQKLCENVLQYNNTENGAVVVLDAQTSEILALASSPVFDRDNMSASLKDENSPFLNRALSAYSVGSVFKPVVAAAALEQGISADTVFECEGFVKVNGVRFNCHKKDGHGALDMTGAMAVSCNSYFIQLGQLTSAEKIISIAEQLGFGEKISLADSIVSSGGILPVAEEVDSAPALANLSFGQGTLLATPLQIGALYCAFVNGGYYRDPFILKEIVDGNGKSEAYYKNETNNKVLTDSVCNSICKMLEETVVSGSGKLAAPMMYNAAGKTATAETGWIENGREIVHTWFAGYYPANNPQYVIVVFKEDGSSSATECAPIFRDIVDNISSEK